MRPKWKRKKKEGQPLCGRSKYCSMIPDKAPEKHKDASCIQQCIDIPSHVPRALTHVYLGILNAAKVDKMLITRWSMAGTLDWEDMQILGTGVSHGV